MWAADCFFLLFRQRTVKCFEPFVVFGDFPLRDCEWLLFSELQIQSIPAGGSLTRPMCGGSVLAFPTCGPLLRVVPALFSQYKSANICLKMYLKVKALTHVEQWFPSDYISTSNIIKLLLLMCSFVSSIARCGGFYIWMLLDRWINAQHFISSS